MMISQVVKSASPANTAAIWFTCHFNYCPLKAMMQRRWSVSESGPVLGGVQGAEGDRGAGAEGEDSGRPALGG
ncbi:hypothetical protein E2C01_087480 [Portunus trituberculatus]|uniref:Uncharacterized protein n=1 Tax=Portunus trituberculatus TaxID=210409 RepID=A0A5B7J875_PORTR|nr:hypothetical protein [Portunus trituberculatus]